MSSKVTSPSYMSLKIYNGASKSINLTGEIFGLLKQYFKSLKSIGSLDPRILADPLRK